MSLQYGRSQAAALIDGEDYEAAVTAATEALAREPQNSEHWFERATALAWLERYEEACADFEKTKVLDVVTQVVEEEALDDGYFSSLLGAARTKDVTEGCALLQRYATVWPDGRHVQDAQEWQERLRGERKSHFVKERLASD